MNSWNHRAIRLAALSAVVNCCWGLWPETAVPLQKTVFSHEALAARASAFDVPLTEAVPLHASVSAAASEFVRGYLQKHPSLKNKIQPATLSDITVQSLIQNPTLLESFLAEWKIRLSRAQIDEAVKAIRKGLQRSREEPSKKNNYFSPKGTTRLQLVGGSETFDEKLFADKLTAVQLEEGLTIAWQALERAGGTLEITSPQLKTMNPVFNAIVRKEGIATDRQDRSSTQAVFARAKTDPSSQPILAMLPAIGERIVVLPDLKDLQEAEFPMDLVVSVPRRLRPRVPELFLSGEELTDAMYNHPVWGFYRAGKMNFKTTYQTAPIHAYPHFGNMAAEHAFQMWLGMRRAGTLRQDQPFDVIEPAFGTGALAAGFLEHVLLTSRTSADRQAFARQVHYHMGDISPQGVQRARDKFPILASRVFQRQVHMHEADAMDFLNGLGTGRQGIFISNEYLDNMPHQSLRWNEDGEPEITYLLPFFSDKGVRMLRAAGLWPEEASLFQTTYGGPPGWVALPKADFLELRTRLENPLHETLRVQLQGTVFIGAYYGPARDNAEMAEYLDRNLYLSAWKIKQEGLPHLFTAPRHATLWRKIGQILQHGYVITLDYMYSGDLAESIYGSQLKIFRDQHLRKSDWRIDMGNYDLTFRPDLSNLVSMGDSLGWKTLFYGAQKALQAGTGISIRSEQRYTALRVAKMIDRLHFLSDLEPVNFRRFLESRSLSMEEMEQLMEDVVRMPELLDVLSFPPFIKQIFNYGFEDADFVINFFESEQFNLLVQQLPGTDPHYRFPAPSLLKAV